MYMKCQALFSLETRKTPYGIMDHFFKKVNQKVNLGRQES